MSTTLAEEYIKYNGMYGDLKKSDYPNRLADLLGLELLKL